MWQEERKQLALLLAKRSRWREAYRQTFKNLQAASTGDNWGGREPLPAVNETEWRRLIDANSFAFADLEEIELKIKELSEKVLAEHPNYWSVLNRFLGYRFDEERTSWNDATILAETDPVEGSRVAVLTHDVAADYVKNRPAVITRSISGFNTSDVLLRSGFHPLAFATNHPREYRVPAMLWQLDTGEWIGVDDLSVGYGGVGPRYAEAALQQAGISETNAIRIAGHRFCDVKNLNTAHPAWETSTVWPVEPRLAPEIKDDKLVVHCGDRLETISTDHPSLRINRNPDPDETGFYPSTHNTDPIEAWLDFLDQTQDSLPSWAQGERTISFFLDDHSAKDAGYYIEAADYGYGRGNVSYPSIVIHQGHVEIWGHYARPERLRPMHPEVQELAEAAGFTDQVPYLSGEPYTFFEQLNRLFSPEKARTGVYTAEVSPRQRSR